MIGTAESIFTCMAAYVGGMAATPTLVAFPWKPSRSTGVWMNVLSMLVAVVAGYLTFVIAFGGESGTINFDLVGLAITVGIIVVVLVVHEGIHGLAFVAYGGRPTFGAGMMGKVMPYFYCTSLRQRLSVARYLMVALAPTIVVNGALIAALCSPVARWFVVPFAVHMGGCIGDWFLVFRALRAPRGSLVEDMKDGLIIHRPAT